MPAPRNARQTDRGGRSYLWPPTGENFTSVTTLLKALSKDGLIYWSARMVAEGAVARFAELERLIDEDGPDAAVRWLKGLPWEQRDRAADAGSAIHGSIEQIILGKPLPRWPKSLERQRVQFGRFLEAYRPEFVMAEATVYNRRYRYAGTLDFLARIGGRLLLVDVKTGERIYDEVALQLAPYRYAEFIGLPDGSEQPMPAVDGCAVLHLRPEMYALPEIAADEEAFRYFLHIAQAHRFQQEVAARSRIGEMVTPVNLVPPAAPEPATEEALA